MGDSKNSPPDMARFMDTHKEYVMTKAKRAIIVLGIVVAIVPCVYLVYAVGMIIITAITMEYDSYKDIAQWHERTTPLENEVAVDLCNKFTISDNDPRCQPGAVVYAPDFFQTIGKTFQPADQTWATYEEVEAKLGAYKYNQEPLVTESDGKQYFRCWYDLRGDRVYPIVIDFYSDGRLWRMIADVRD